uniref:Adenomatous polyposis coli N-terminal dimerisation domain-containing protein n=1 Tax=Myripristis murdjan TaxID=586833 RepID=A0A667Y0T5_9TELE
MANAVASYDQLAHQVEALRKENSHLRRELEDNSHHLSKLETETSGMKEVLKQLQSKLEQEAGTLASSGRSDVLDQLKGLLYWLLCSGLLIICIGPEMSPSLMKPNAPSCPGRRSLLLGEIDREERERCWYYTQLQALSQRLAQLPRIDTFSLQMDLIRQQLEFEAQQVRSVMEERFGTSDEMVQRTQFIIQQI